MARGPKSASKPRPAPKKTNTLANANKALAEANARMEAQVAELRAQLQTLNQQATAPSAPAVPNHNNNNNQLIPRPPGEHGRNWRLSDILYEYHVSTADYNRMLAAVRDSAKIAQLDNTAKYRAQDPVKLAQIFAVMRKQFPLLKQFRSDWVTAEMLKQALRNWRSREKRGYVNKIEMERVNFASSYEGTPEV